MSAMMAIVAAAGVQAAGQIGAGESARAAASRNAEIMRREAELNQQQGVARAVAQERRGRELLGQQRAAIGQAGIGWEGSAEDVMRESSTMAQLDVMSTFYESALQSTAMRNRASIAEWEGKQARRASRVGAATSLLMGAANYGLASSMAGQSLTAAPIYQSSPSFIRG